MHVDQCRARLDLMGWATSDGAAHIICRGYPRSVKTTIGARGPDFLGGSATLSGHTSPCGECACSHLEATLGDWLPAQLVFYFLTLAPRDYVIYYQA